MGRRLDHARLSDFDEVQKACAKVVTTAQLSSVIDAAIREFGFRWFALVHDGHLQKQRPEQLMMTNYPASWVDEVISHRLYMHDPVHIASARSAFGLCWERIADVIAPTRRQLSVLTRGRDHGLVSGFTIPFRIPGERGAFFTVARKRDRPFSNVEMMTARLIAGVAFQRGRELVGGIELTVPSVSLSPRQIQCLELIAEGKTDWEIGTILGLSQNTIHEYIEEARRRYQVKTRSQLVLAAVRDGKISFNHMK